MCVCACANVCMCVLVCWRVCVCGYVSILIHYVAYIPIMRNFEFFCQELLHRMECIHVWVYGCVYVCGFMSVCMFVCMYCMFVGVCDTPTNHNRTHN